MISHLIYFINHLNLTFYGGKIVYFLTLNTIYTEIQMYTISANFFWKTKKT